MPYKEIDKTQVVWAHSNRKERTSLLSTWSDSESHDSMETVVQREWRSTSTTPGFRGKVIVHEGKTIQYYVPYTDSKGRVRYRLRRKRLKPIYKRAMTTNLRTLYFAAGGFSREGTYRAKREEYKPNPGEEPGSFLSVVTEDYGDLARVMGPPNVKEAQQVEFDRLYLKLAGKVGRGEFDAPLFLVEGKETVNMLFSIAERLRRGATSLLSGRFMESIGHLFPDLYNWSKADFPSGPRDRRARYYDRRLGVAYRRFEEARVGPEGPVRAASSAWLELQFGILQILEDAKSIAEYCAERVYAAGDDGRLCRASVTYRSKSDSGFVDGLFTISPPINQRRRDVLLESYKVYIKWRVQSQVLRNLQELGLTNPAKLAWNATRLSWVVDWFTPITSWLGQFDSYLGLEFLDGGQGYSCDEVATFQPGAGGGPSGTVKGWHVKRWPLGGFPYASAEVLVPQLPDMGVWKVTTSLALLGQTLTRMSGSRT